MTFNASRPAPAPATAWMLLVMSGLLVASEVVTPSRKAITSAPIPRLANGYKITNNNTLM